ncbi:MAG: diguanylate cyclase domain-containing protein, partial [Alphaproteobacteria bacterium]
VAHLEMKKMAHHDPLTGLANRRLFQEHVHHAVEVARRAKSEVVLMMIDLDGFKEVNDTLGHHAGDQVLCTVAHRIHDTFRSADLVARLGGDEFAVLLEIAGGIESATVMARRLGNVLMAPISVQGRDVRVRASIGIAAFPEHADDASALGRNADTAMYRAKKARKTYAVYGLGAAEGLALTG